MKDQKFSEISREDVSQLLQRDDLAVKSEADLFEAVTRWGLKQVTKANQKPTPELIRQMLGPSIIKNIRFLTMTGAEFSRIHLSSRILDYEEGLAVLLYINSPGGLDMPDTLSSNTQKRKAKNGGPDTFYSVSRGLGKCKDSIEDSKANSDLYTTTEIPNTDQWMVHGIQIPKSLESRADCSLTEHFDVLILDSSDNIVFNFTYNQVPSCISRRYKFNTHGSAIAYDDKNLISVQFVSHFTVPRYTGANRYKIKTVFYEIREYPKWIDAGEATASSTRSEYSNYGPTYFTSSNQKYGYFRILHNRPFVYSIFMA
jgi:BTB And C-terminal Kelch